MSCLDDFEKLDMLGRGKFSEVFRARRKTDGRVVALKQIEIYEMIDRKARDECWRETEMLKNLKHPNIIEYLDSFVENNVLYIVLELATRDLRVVLKDAIEKKTPLNEKTIWNIFIQICSGLRHMRSRKVMHRDIKPANVFLTDEGTIKIGDLGLSRYFSSKTLYAKTMVGTPLYMSPELIRGHGYNYQSDIWALGCLLYESMTLKNPFFQRGYNLYQLGMLIEKGEYEPIDDTYSDALRNLVAGMIRTDPKERMNIAQVYEEARANAVLHGCAPEHTMHPTDSPIPSDSEAVGMDIETAPRPPSTS